MADTETTEDMPVVEYLDRLQAMVNTFIRDANAVRKSLATGLNQLNDDPAFKLLEAKQPTLVKAILDVEIARISTEVTS